MARHAERGTTLIEVMLAGTILLIAILGFVATAAASANATAVAHRRSVASYFRSSLLERYVVTGRSAYAGIPADTWVVDGCYDVDSRLLGRNTSFSTSFTCGSGAVYRTWVRLGGGTAGPWALSTYAERMDPGCTAAQRYTSLACVAADLYVTD
jgi:Tfp pilus assembly protein PilV